MWNPVFWIFFDLDDTLWNFSDNSSDSLVKLYNDSPILKKLFKDINEFIDIYHKNNSLMWDYYSKGMISTTELKLERWRRTLATKQFEVLTAVCEELDSNYLDILARGEKKFDGVDEMLERLTKKHLIAVLSNGFAKTQYKKLHYSGLEKYITRTIVSEEIGINKPNPKLFDYARNETGARFPILMVGDNLETDILGAIKAGWHAIWYNPRQKEFPYSSKELFEMNVNPDLLTGIVKDIKELEVSINQFYSHI